MFLSTIGICAVLLAAPPIQAEAMPKDHIRRHSKKVMLNFDATPLTDVVKKISKFTGKNFIVESRVRRKKLTIISGRKVSRKEAYQAFVDALEAEGLIIEAKGKFIKISKGDSRRRRTSLSNRCPALDGITKQDQNTWLIPITLFRGLLENARCIGESARIVPHMKDGKPVGFKVFAIPPDSLLAKIGFQNGDVIQRINGQEFSSPDKALEIYTKLRDAQAIRIQFLRRGKSQNLTIKIQ